MSLPRRKRRLVCEEDPSSNVAEDWSAHTGEYTTIKGKLVKANYSSKDRHLRMEPTHISYTDPRNEKEMTFRWLRFVTDAPCSLELPAPIKERLKDTLGSKLEDLSLLTVQLNENEKPLQWNLSSDEYSRTTLLKTLQRAFTCNMRDTEGKSAVFSLCQEVIKALDLKDIEVIQVGGSSAKKSRFARTVNFRFTPYSEGKEMKLPQMSKSSQAQVEQADNLDSLDMTKTLVSDIVVCKDIMPSEAPFVLLLISVKSGFLKYDDLQQLYLEMASHMAYQDEIYGLQICSSCANLLHMYKDKNESSHLVYNYEVDKYTFFVADQSTTFHENGFQKMVKHLCCVINTMSCNS